jgi:hypothetical protein
MPAPLRKPAANTDIRDQPASTFAEGARYLRLAVATLRSWALGRAYPTAAGALPFLTGDAIADVLSTQEEDRWQSQA